MLGKISISMCGTYTAYMGLFDLDGVNEGMPVEEGETAEPGDHDVEAERGRFVDLVWVCENCGMRSQVLDDFKEEDCN